MKTKTEKPLPKKLAGAVCVQMVRCGKPACKCASGALHGPYFYRFVRVNGQLRKLYVRKNDLATTVLACTANRQEQTQWRQQRQEAWQKLRQLKAQFDELSKMM